MLEIKASSSSSSTRKRSNQMKYIDRLLQGAPVEWCTLGEVAEYEQPTKYLVKSTNYKDSFPTPVLTAGKSFILGYTDEIDGIYKASESPVIIFDDFTTANKWVDFDFKAKSSAMKMITSRDPSKFSLRYIYHWLNTLPSGLVESDHKRQWISNYSKKKIPIPPVAVQEEVVRVLDKFTALEAELEAELDCRKRQYGYYRDALLTFDLSPSDGLCHSPLFSATFAVEWRPLGEVGEMKKGKQLNKRELVQEGLYPAYNGGVTYSGFTNTYNYPANTIIVSQGGASAGFVNFVTSKFYANAHCYVVLPDIERVNNRYLYHVLKWCQNTLMQKQQGAGIPGLSSAKLLQTSIPIPPLAVQERIVEILDKFDTLVNSISEGLPREIELRRKQYEYYRDALLSFEPLISNF